MGSGADPRGDLERYPPTNGASDSCGENGGRFKNLVFSEQIHYRAANRNRIILRMPVNKGDW
jgi:hypothetical protein